MKLQEIRAIAKQHQINSSALSKIRLMREIQRQEGNFNCFATACVGDATSWSACGARTVLARPPPDTAAATAIMCNLTQRGTRWK